MRRYKEDHFKPRVYNKYMSMYYWLDFIAEQEGVTIQHKLNANHEKRVGSKFVDGYCEETNTVYEFNGCYHHGHQCYLTRHITKPDQVKKQEAKYKRTQEKEKFLRRCGYFVTSIWECEYKKWVEPRVQNVRDRYLPTYYQSHKRALSETEILTDVYHGDLFGMLEVDLEVPEVWPSWFQHEMSPRVF